MIHFNEEAVKYGVAMCKSRPNYKVGVVVTPHLRTQAFDAMHSAIAGEDCIVRKGNQYMQVIFQNGSTIRTIPATINSRGHRAHLLIVDDLVDDELYDQIFRRIEMLEGVDRQRRIYEQDRGHRADFVFVDEIPGGELVNTFLNEYDAKFDAETENEKFIADIDEDEFMDILNISNPQ